MNVADYAWSRPDLEQLKAAGFTGVIRYLCNRSTDSPESTDGKRITPSEAADIRAHGLDLGLVWETTANRAGDGFAAGAGDALKAEQQADEIGYPADAAIYYAVDYEASATQVLYYFSGVRRSARRPVGVYGSYQVVEGVADMGLATYLWQTVAWSYGARSDRAHLYQRNDFALPKVDGDYDENEVLQPADWGGWTYTVKADVDPLQLHGRTLLVRA